VRGSDHSTALYSWGVVVGSSWMLRIRAGKLSRGEPNNTATFPIDQPLQILRPANQHALHNHHRDGGPAGPHLECEAPMPPAEEAAPTLCGYRRKNSRSYRQSYRHRAESAFRDETGADLEGQSTRCRSANIARRHRADRTQTHRTWPGFLEERIEPTASSRINPYVFGIGHARSSRISKRLRKCLLDFPRLRPHWWRHRQGQMDVPGPNWSRVH
jgi:hypothetical protein